MEFTLREIADALWTTRGDTSAEERQRIYDRARMLRDKGLIKTSANRSQGKVTTFTEADVAAAIVALTANLNGMSWGIIEAMNSRLRAIGNTMGAPRFEEYLAEIKAGIPIYARVEIILHPWPSTDAIMGGAEVLQTDISSDTTQVLLWPVTALAKPVLELLSER